MSLVAKIILDRPKSWASIPKNRFLCQKLTGFRRWLDDLEIRKYLEMSITRLLQTFLRSVQLMSSLKIGCQVQSKFLIFFSAWVHFKVGRNLKKLFWPKVDDIIYKLGLSWAKIGYLCKRPFLLHILCEVFLCVRLPVRSSSFELIYLWGHHPVRH